MKVLFISLFALYAFALEEAVEPGFKPLSPNEKPAPRMNNSPAAPVNNNRGSLPSMPNFDITFQAPKDTSHEDAKRQLRLQEEELKRKQREADFNSKKEELKRKEEDLKRKQEQFQKRQEEEKKRRQEEEAERKKKQKEEQEERKKQQPQRRMEGAPITTTANFNPTVKKEAPPKKEDNNNKKKEDEKKKDEKKDEKKVENKDDKKKDAKPKVNPNRRPLPKRYEVPKNAGIGGKLGGSISDPGISLDPADIFKKNPADVLKSAGSSLSGSLLNLLPVLLAMLHLL